MECFFFSDIRIAEEGHRKGTGRLRFCTFDTGLDLELLQEFCRIALDVFREIPYAKGEKNIRAAVLSN
ncbi:hypothetical protein B5E77_03120 [Lachnoclostridium sp. An131]|nr:hypothetical protein B5E77_03120 [Lachnoclostridium sp. An131]